ncbi:MAG: ABC transporter substrate-binding protein [Spirochaetaceae bacterium]|jgi:peptide/nickel transport system substrate-binding protein|nr:ABC transporter substrate-binding protein [Spirochaetaceae bacterium]
MKKLIPVLLILAVFTACGRKDSGGSQSAEGTAAGAALTIAMHEDIQSLDPGQAWDFTTNQVAGQIAEGLVGLDSNDAIVPVLAKSWTQTDDLTYVYDVRDDILFSDGSKLTMDDVLFSFERSRDPEGGTYFADFFADVESFTVDGWQFIIKLATPSAVFKYVPATGAGWIISKAYFEKQGGNFGTASGGVVGTGPFMYQSWTSGQEVVLKKNPNYWDKEKLAANIFDTVVYKAIPDDTTRVIALQNGDVDFSINLPLDMLDQLSSAASLNYYSFETYHVDSLGFNTQRPPFDDVNARRAVALALDIPRMHSVTVKDAGIAGDILPFGPGLYGADKAKWEDYVKNSPYNSYNLDEAKRLLAASRYPGGFSCDLVIGEASVTGDWALFIQESLKALNISVEIRKMTGEEQDLRQNGQVFDGNGKRDYDMLIGGWEADYPDLNGNIDILLKSSQAGENGYNHAAYARPGVDALIDQQRTTLDPVKRFEVQKELMDIVVNDVPYIYLTYPSRQYVLSKKYVSPAVTASWLWSLPLQDIRRAN